MVQEVERYKKSTRVLHWIHTSSFIVLFITGLFLFIPQLGFIAQDSWTRLLHRIAVIVFVLAPLIYLIASPKAAAAGIKEAFTWGKEDIGWLKAAPRYYMFCDEKVMPPQGHMNTGQKMWWFLVIVCGIIFAITGLFMWFFKDIVPAGVLQWSVFIHDIAFIVTGAMFFVHIYMAIHPLMKGHSWGSMARGKVSVEYAKSHHGKWYKSIAKS